MTFTHALPHYQDTRIATLYSVVKVFAGSLLMALSAQWIIPLQPVPITFQTLMAMLLGLFLGPRLGAYSVMLYLVQITIGLPVTAGGMANPMALVGPKAGYLFGMVMQAYCVGWYVRRFTKLTSLETFTTFLMISLGQLTLGAVVLGFFMGAKVAFFAGFLPFVAIEMVKSALVMRFRG